MTQFLANFYDIRTRSVGAQDECMYQVWNQFTEKCAKKVRKVEHFPSFGTKRLKIRKKIKIHISTKPVIYIILINKESQVWNWLNKSITKKSVENPNGRTDVDDDNSVSVTGEALWAWLACTKPSLWGLRPLHVLVSGNISTIELI